MILLFSRKFYFQIDFQVLPLHTAAWINSMKKSNFQLLKKYGNPLSLTL